MSSGTTTLHSQPTTNNDAQADVTITPLVSIGDYVLAGGEAAALVMIEAVVRLLPNVMGNPQSHQDDSHSPENAGLLEGPSYTRPPSWRGLRVPDVLLSGDHARIRAWRHEQAQQRTRDRRPDLLGE